VPAFCLWNNGLKRLRALAFWLAYRPLVFLRPSPVVATEVAQQPRCAVSFAACEFKCYEDFVGQNRILMLTQYSAAGNTPGQVLFKAVVINGIKRRPGR
jgi:hypothetical protein